MRAVARPFAVALALAVLLRSAPASDAAESWAAVGIQVREGRRPAAGVEVRMWPETASTAEAGALATGVTDGEGRAVLYVRPGIWRLELSTGERVDYFVTVRVGPGRRAEELGSPARDVNAPDLRWRYFVVDEPPPLELPAPIRREEPAATESAPDEPAAATAPAATEPAPDEPAAATAPADEPDATRAGDETPPADAPQPPAEADSVVPPPATPPADPVSAEPPSVPVAPEGSAPEAEPSGPADETADPTPSDSSPFDTLPRPASPYDPSPAPAVPEPVEEEAEDAAPVPAEPAQPPAAVPQ
ncbi:MAG TPA: hypothetical protein VM617_05290, partial [Thermoanaerobaculia bacterium]|nr:hypothetical protein [Thermoanaerobaculia bacterium]